MLKKLFGFDHSKHSVKTEIIAGITTFVTMAYILAVNPSIFADLGNILGADKGMPADAVFTATALAAVVGTMIMAFYAKKPFGLAPGMGLNAFVVYTVCVSMGYSWRFALTAILIEGLIFIVLSATNVRNFIVDAFPDSLKRSIGVGIGFFIALIGLKNAGIVVADESTAVALGNLGDPAVTLALGCFILTAALVMLRVKGGMLIGILLATIVGIPLGVTQMSGMVSAPPSVAPIFCQFEWSQVFSWDMLIVVFTFLFLDIFDTMGTVVGLAVKADMVDRDGKMPGASRVFMADALATTAGACLGTNTTTTYIESASGIASGGRTGLTSFTIAVCFLLSLFFAPLFLAIPSAATGPVLAIVGVMMCSPVRGIDWEDFSESIPAFVTIFFMPFAYSISDGIMLGVITYVLLNVICGKYCKINATMAVLAVLFILRYVFVQFIG